MRSKYIAIILLLLLLPLTGCETAKGFKKDVQNTLEGFENKDNVFYKMDAWLRKQLW